MRNAAKVPFGEVFQRKVVGLGMRLFGWGSQVLYRASLRRGKLAGLDHVTLPCRDLRVAEEFYVGVLGARLMLRIDEAMLNKMGRPKEQIGDGAHLTVNFAGGPRIDLFMSQADRSTLPAPHPHYAFWVSPHMLLDWKKRLHDRGIPSYGPTRLGPPGQASLYFQDPFGNLLEITTVGFTGELPVGVPELSGLTYEWRG